MKIQKLTMIIEELGKNELSKWDIWLSLEIEIYYSKYEAVIQHQQIILYIFIKIMKINILCKHFPLL